MKTNAFYTAVAVLALASSLTVGAAAAQQGQDRRGQQSQPDRQQQSGDDRAGNDYRDRREGWRDDRSNTRWDETRYNGYFYNNRWTFGPPESNRFGVVFGYHPWARGDRLGYYNGRFTEVNYRDENLRKPPRGSRWVRDDRGDYLLVSIRTGLIAQVIVNNRSYSDGREESRDNRREARWDPKQHNGYYQNNAWHSGPPPAGQYGRAGFALGYHPWERGEKLGYYNGRFADVDYRTHGLRPPPRDQHWVQDDRGDFLLVAIATGLIAEVIMNQRG
ncbi:MAG: RcnB family protein [Hyphomonadaceae bacterium]